MSKEDLLEFTGEGISLKEEGILYIRVQKPFDRPEENIGLFDDGVSFRHNCRSKNEDLEGEEGIVSVKHIPGRKNVIFCHDCGLRISLPLAVDNKKKLREEYQ